MSKTIGQKKGSFQIAAVIYVNLAPVDFPINRQTDFNIVFSVLQKKYQLSLFNCVKAFLGIYKPTPNREFYYNIFKIVTCLIALAHSENEDQISLQTYEDLELDDGDNAYNFSGDLYREILKHEPRLWTETSDEACIFITLLRRTSGSTLPGNIEVITAILKEIMSNDTDAMLKINVLRELAACLQKKNVLLDIMKKRFSMVMESIKKLMEGIFHRPDKSNFSDTNSSQRFSHHHYSGTLAPPQKQ